MIDRPIQPERGIILVFGISRGGTNLCAQRLHGLRGVVSLNETASRFVLPEELTAGRGLSSRQIIEGCLPPPKDPAGGFDYLALNKINYALRCYPQHWMDFARDDQRVRSILLFRNPFEVHRSRCNWVKRYKPQRVRWLGTEQLARDWMEQCRIAADLLQTGRARVMIHERTAEDREGFVKQIIDLCGAKLADDHADVPTKCLRCAGAIERRRRYEWDENEWLYCAKCDLFLAGFGDYNFIRVAGNEDFAGWKRRLDEKLIPEFKERLGEKIAEFFLNDSHLRDDGEQRLTEAISGQRELHLKTPLDDILYPY